ncbi:MAG: rhodanese-like domain-containing protein [Nitrospirae bacterium]|nr:rhodanese-like domain-containing protein [Nitrospirota bacterium]
MVNILRKKALAKLNILLVITLCAVGASAAGPHKVITGEELQALMKDGQPVKIVDVREPELFKSGHVPGAINIPYDTAHGRILKELSPKDRVVFICHGGPMGDELGGILTKNGYTKVYNVKGGMKKWRGPLEQSK